MLINFGFSKIRLYSNKITKTTHYLRFSMLFFHSHKKNISERKQLLLNKTSEKDLFLRATKLIQKIT